VVNAPPQSQAFPAFINLLCFPGLGQLIQGRLLAAIIWWCLHVMAAASCVIGIGFVLWPIVWIACVIDAARYNPMAHNSESGTSTAVMVMAAIVALIVAVPVFIFGGLAVLAAIMPSPESLPVAAKSDPPAVIMRAVDAQPMIETGDSPSPIILEAIPVPVETAPPAPIVPVAPAPITVSPPVAASPPVEKPIPVLEPPSNIRVWQAAEGGFRVEAEFLFFATGKVKLKRVDTGKELLIDLDKLSPDDVAWVEAKRKAAKN
jgi:hypothetical protein